MASRRSVLLAQGIAVGLTYFAAAKLGLAMAVVAEQVTVVWPPTGIAIAAAVLLGPRALPAIWAGAFAANATTPNTPLLVAAVIAVGNTLEAVLAAWGLRLGQFDPSLRRLRDVLALVVIAAGASTVVSATIGVTALYTAGLQPSSAYGTLWSIWWVGDAMGALVVAPALLSCSHLHRDLEPSRRVEAMSLLVVLIAVGQITFGAIAHEDLSLYPLEFVIFPFVMWAAVRFGPPTTAVVILVAATLTILHAVARGAPVAVPGAPAQLVLLQIHMSVLAVSGLMLAAATRERVTAERRRAANHRSARILAEASTFEDAAPAILHAMLSSLHWDVGALWRLDAERGELRCITVVSRPGCEAPVFCADTATRTFAPGRGLPGRVWGDGDACWIEDVLHDPNFPRASAASSDGLRSGFAFPIRLGSDVLGVVEIFSRTIEVLDRELLATMAAIGPHIGQFIERKRAEAERVDLLAREQEARRAAEMASRAKDDFLATVSHELRTPLNAIAGWTSMLRAGMLDEVSASRALEIIDRNAQSQVQLVADLLDVSRIVTGGLRLQVAPVDLGSVIGAAVDAVRPSADARQVGLRTVLAASTRLVMGDGVRLQQVVWNLLTNAVKFSDVGSVVEVHLRDGTDGAIELRVTDSGIGIDQEFLPHVFDRFRQADTSTTRRHGGLGLGLAIVRYLAELHGGSVEADSGGAGKGATFKVFLPPACIIRDMEVRDPLRHDANSAPFVLPPCRVLVVDDEPDARELLSTLLRRAGAHVATAASVPEALARWNDHDPDVLLADIAMPDEDGYALIAHVRTRPSPKPVIAVAVTAYTRDEDRARALAAGFDAHLAKPVVPLAILRLVADLLSGLSHGRPTTSMH